MYEGPGPEGTSARVEASIGAALAAGCLWLYLLLPIGVPAFRMGSELAVVAAAAVGALYFLAREIGASSWAAATAAAAFGASPGNWNPASRVEGGSLPVLLVILLLLAGLRYRRTGRWMDLAVMALVGSWGLASPMALALTGPALLCLCGRRLWMRPGRGWRLAMLGTLLPAGMALSLLLVGARGEPLAAWGHWVRAPLLGIRVCGPSFSVSSAIPDAPALAQRLCHEWTLFRENFPYLTFTLPLLGAGLLWLQRRALAAGLLLLALAAAGCNLCFPINDIAWCYPSIWMVAAVFTAVSLDRLRALVCGPRPGTAFAALVSLLLVAAPLRRNWSACDLSRATGPEISRGRSG